MDLVTDPSREFPEGKSEVEISTGIFVRAKRSNGQWGAVDIRELDKRSLLAWLRSRGGENAYAENVVGYLLGHDGMLVELPDHENRRFT